MCPRSPSTAALATLAEIDETTASTLRFGDDQIASFVTSFNAADVAAYRIVGTKGHLHADPAYEYAEGLEYALTIGGRTTRKTVGKRDQFAPELVYFSDCILSDRQARAIGRGGNAGRTDRPGALSIGANRPVDRHSPVREAQQANVSTANDTSRRQEACFGQGAERRPRLTLKSRQQNDRVVYQDTPRGSSAFSVSRKSMYLNWVAPSNSKPLIGWVSSGSGASPFCTTRSPSG